MITRGSPTTLAGIIAIGLLGGLLAGGYPALLLSGFSPSLAFRSSPATTGGQGRLRKGLVIMQFAVAAGLIAVTALVHRQIDYVRTMDLGFDREQVVLMQTGYPGVNARRHLLIERLQAHPAIAHATSVRQVPPEVLSQRGVFRVEGVDADVSMSFTSADPGLPDLFGIRLVAGHDHQEPHDRRHQATFLVNQSALRAFGFESPDEILGRHLEYRYRGRDGGEGPVVGVMEDFHFETLHVPVGPLVITNSWGTAYVAVRLADVEHGLQHLRETWDDVNPDWPLDYRFLDDSLEAAYRSEERYRTMLTVFCALAVVISGLGVFALAAYAAQQRTREGVSARYSVPVPSVSSCSW